MSDYDTADMKNLHYHAFNYRNAHSTDAGNAFNLLEEFVSKMCITAGEKWREEWSKVCNENQILSNKLAGDDALLLQVLEALSACDIYAYAGGEGLMSTKHTGALKAIRTILGLKCQ